MRKRANSVEQKHAPRNANYHFRLFVAGDEPNSKLARENLTKLCRQHLKGDYELEVVDVLEDFQAALENNVLITPTLVVGTLSDTEKVLAALGLNGGA
jgi:circadian clock protein KaiB